MHGRIIISFVLAAFCAGGCATGRAPDENGRDLAATERQILRQYQQMYPAQPDGPNAQPVNRVIVTLENDTPSARLFNAINGRLFTQQWCLMPPKEGHLRLGLDIADYGSYGSEARGALTALEAVDGVLEAGLGDDSPYLRRVMGSVQWREAHNSAPYELLVQHTAAGTPRDDVRRLLGPPREDDAANDRWCYRFWLGLHAWLDYCLVFEANEVKTTTVEYGTAMPPGPQSRPDAD